MALLAIAQDPEARMQDIAADVGITERAAQRIVSDLIEAGYLDRERVGRRNRYTIRTGLPISLLASRDVDLSALLDVLLPERSSGGPPRGDARRNSRRRRQHRDRSSFKTAHASLGPE